MLTGDLINIFGWWIVFFLTGLTFLPLTVNLFQHFFDKGYIFAKILGILIISYSIWFLASLKILSFSTFNIFLVTFIFLIINLVIISKKNTTQIIKGNLKIFFFEEILFTLGLIFWSYIKSFEPSIHGLEKFMDFGFINSILRSEYFPPKDLWLTPFSINYYYFGHLATAVLTKISGIDSVVTYNLMLASLFGLTLTASFSIGANLYHFFTQNHSAHKLSAGLFSAFLVTLGGNLHTIYAFFQNYNTENPVPFWQLPLQTNFSGYWYPNATRFIPFTIHEFPLYSFVVSDLHGHVFNIPFVLLMIALLLKTFFDHKLSITHYLLFSLLIAVSLMTNVLDGPIYLLAIFLAFTVKQFFANQSLKKDWLKILTVSGKQLVLILITTIIFSLPFWLSFKPFGSGVGMLCAPDFLTSIGRIGPLLFEANHCARSPLWMLTILWGFFYFVLLGFIYFLVTREQKRREATHFIVTDHLVLVLAFFSTILIFIPEFFYVKDIYPAHYRANTVFKFGYQAFIILGLISGYMITRLILNFKTQSANWRTKLSYSIFLTFAFCFLILVSIYPYFAVNSYFNGLKNYQGLDGLNYLNNLYPSDYQAILWLNQNIKGQPVILEGQGDSYTDYARVSSNTGLPTVVGWPVHEWLWRGSYDEAGKRVAEVTQLYENQDINLTKQLLQRYNVQYVFIGDLERQKYQSLHEAKFVQLGKIIYQNGGTKIYQLN